jgi:hypothetical protein
MTTLGPTLWNCFIRPLRARQPPSTHGGAQNCLTGWVPMDTGLFVRRPTQRVSDSVRSGKDIRNADNCRGMYTDTRRGTTDISAKIPRRCQLQYLHNNLASRRRRCKGKPEPGTRGYNWATLSQKGTNTKAWTSRLAGGGFERKADDTAL